MPRRLFTLNRWNWSQKAEKWVYVRINKEGKREYLYQIEPPKEFVNLTVKIKKLNEKLLETADPDENMKIFNEIVEISKKMQEMGKSI
ncbi:MAG: hypothetical protein ACFE91_00995 [Promethearchaeota archaeon]